MAPMRTTMMLTASREAEKPREVEPEGCHDPGDNRQSEEAKRVKRFRNTVNRGEKNYEMKKEARKRKGEEREKKKEKEKVIVNILVLSDYANAT